MTETLKMRAPGTASEGKISAKCSRTVYDPGDMGIEYWYTVLVLLPNERSVLYMGYSCAAAAPVIGSDSVIPATDSADHEALFSARPALL